MRVLLRTFLSRLQSLQIAAGSKRPPVQRLIDPLDFFLVDPALSRALFGGCVLMPPSVVFRSSFVMP
jgi:hypothetical protein